MATRYVITVDFLDDGQVKVQAEHDSLPLTIFEETGYLVGRVLMGAYGAIVDDRNRKAAAS
jgi:hypothetical protein